MFSHALIPKIKGLFAVVALKFHLILWSLDQRRYIGPILKCNPGCNAFVDI